VPYGPFPWLNSFLVSKTYRTVILRCLLCPLVKTCNLSQNIQQILGTVKPAPCFVGCISRTTEGIDHLLALKIGCNTIGASRNRVEEQGCKLCQSLSTLHSIANLEELWTQSKSKHLAYPLSPKTRYITRYA
jgi:hypothetical protein